MSQIWERIQCDRSNSHGKENESTDASTSRSPCSVSSPSVVSPDFELADMPGSTKSSDTDSNNNNKNQINNKINTNEIINNINNAENKCIEEYNTLPLAIIDTDDERFKQFSTLLNALSSLRGDWLVDEAYSIALEMAASERRLRFMAEALHQKWLSDISFPPVAVRICHRLADINVDDASFRSIIYSLVHNDYKDRLRIRNMSRIVFCNSVHFAFEFFRWFRVPEKGPNKQSTFDILIEPLFDYLFLLVDPTTSDEEMSLFHYLMFVNGQLMENFSYAKIRQLMLNVRKLVIAVDVRATHKAMMMELIELHSLRWQVDEDLHSDIFEIYAMYRSSNYSLNTDLREQRSSKELLQLPQ